MEMKDKDLFNPAVELVEESATESTRVPTAGNERDSFPEDHCAESKRHESLQADEAGESSMGQIERADPTGSQKIVRRMPTRGLAIPQALEAVCPNEPSEGSSRSLSPEIKQSITASRKSSNLLRGLHYLSPTYPHFISPTGQPEGLYCKTKRGVETRLVGKRREVKFEHLQHFHDGLPSRATATLEGATSALSSLQLAHRTYQQKYAPERAHTMCSESPGINRRIGLAPWHRKDSQGSAWSVSSSVREVLRGKTPAITPNPAMEYDGQKGKTYTTVDITNSSDSTFLPSEARRVHIPPSSGHACGGQPRGFFDLAPSSKSAGANAFSNEKSSGNWNQTAGSKGKLDWWGSEDLATDPFLSNGTERINSEVEIPEHLPNSPLCPMHPKHKSGGTGLCIYHGRKKSYEI